MFMSCLPSPGPQNRLKKEALKVIASHLPAEEIAGLKELFQSMDTDASGTITVSTVCSAVTQLSSSAHQRT